jgi:hypothetical protein
MSEEEAFYSSYGWFIGHVESLALEPEACCESQGHYNVAHELWYFIRSEELPSNPPGLLSAEQREAVEHLCSSVAAIPEEARRWTTIRSESLENMRHTAWEPVRVEAQSLLALLAPVSKAREAFFA